MPASLGSLHLNGASQEAGDTRWRVCTRPRAWGHRLAGASREAGSTRLQVISREGFTSERPWSGLRVKGQYLGTVSVKQLPFD